MAYDLTVHAAKTQVKMVVREQLKEPKVYSKNVPVIEKKLFGPFFKKEAKLVEDAIMALDEEKLAVVSKELAENGCVFCSSKGTES